MRAQAWMLAALFALMAGCYKRPEPNCAFRCGPDGACPTGYGCMDDGQCHLIENGSFAECTALPLGPDAMVSTPDATMSLPDARPPDAMPMPDANETPDADESPDAT